jgi:hypothetical protein
VFSGSHLPAFAENKGHGVVSLGFFNYEFLRLLHLGNEE